MHEAECVSSGLKKVFDKSARPWVNADVSSPERIIDDGVPNSQLATEIIDTETPLSITLSKDGPLLVNGACALDNKVLTYNSHTALCRCGLKFVIALMLK